ncbi:C2H2 transcription factor (AmdA) [Ophiocordyceps camponoti-floridani]|uniref:C2H2 transcription factor (AmdA) n=1 Tax=Ophiocordyceps camponoti-floridani TaxID=2030778 RepID=A0A8H4VH66_9HYPO|nr:C2H2 transcription factor (AmdA) [Ophiocordyceps camponoti-floridani]
MDVRDLLNRHEKLVHLNEGAGKDRRRRTSSAARASSVSEGDPASAVVPPQPLPPPTALPPLPPTPSWPQSLASRRQRYEQDQPHQFPHLQQLQRHQQYQPLEQHLPANPCPGPSPVARATSRPVGACNLDLLSDAALAEPMAACMERPRDDPGPPLFPPLHMYDMGNVLMSDFAAAPYLGPPQLHQDHQTAAWSRPPDGPPLPLPLAPLETDSQEFGDALYRVSAVDHAAIKNRIDEYSAVLPSDFVFPSRQTLTRFLHGYVVGFHEQLPLLHLPTLSPAELAPELLLAVLALGAQCRFESNRGHALWYAAKAVVLEQIRRRHSSDVHALLPTAAAYSPHSTRPSPSTTYRHSFASAQSERPKTQDTHHRHVSDRGQPLTGGPPLDSSPNTPQARMETIQAALLLFAVGLWGAKTILRDALPLQSTLAMLIREEGLSVETSQTILPDWDAWVRLEGANRTKLAAYCLFNLCSLAYDSPPVIMTSELNLYLPLGARLWRADSSWQWQELRQSTPAADMTTYEAVSRLLGWVGGGLPEHLSSFGLYVLVHALMQHVYLLKQTASPAVGLPHGARRMLKAEDVEAVMDALRMWQASFDDHRQARGAEAAAGSLAANAIALLRLVYLRLHADVAPGKALETRDSMLMATALSTTSSPPRGPQPLRAVNHAVQALSMLVNAGVNYMARAKPTEWGMQSSLCDLECAILLATWLLALSGDTASVSAEEKRLLGLVRGMLDETEFAVPIDPSLQVEGAMSDGAKLRQLASAVVRLWAEMFKATHTFDLVRVIGASLDGYANLIDRAVKGRSVGRLLAG